MLVNVISTTKLLWSYHRNCKLLFSAYFRGRAQIPLIRSSIPRVWGYKYSRKNDVFKTFLTNRHLSKLVFISQLLKHKKGNLPSVPDLRLAKPDGVHHIIGIRH